MEKTEKWVNIPGYEMYAVNEKGDVINTKTRHIKSARVNKDGYLRICLRNKERREKTVCIHQLVAECFLRTPADGANYVVNHKDGNKFNNSIQNLEYVKKGENTKHRFDVLLKRSGKDEKPRGVYWRKDRRKWATQLNIFGKNYCFGNYEQKSDAYKAVFDGFTKITGYQPWDEQKFRTFLKDGETVDKYDFDCERARRIEEYEHQTRKEECKAE